MTKFELKGFRLNTEKVGSLLDDAVKAGATRIDGISFVASDPEINAAQQQALKLANGADRTPDLSWVKLERWNGLNPEQKKKFLPLCPDFVIELRSETDTLKTLRNKMQEYLENGTQLGWLIDPQNQRVEIYHLGKEVEILQSPVNLYGEDILPGFVLDLQEIWNIG